MRRAGRRGGWPAELLILKTAVVVLSSAFAPCAWADGRRDLEDGIAFYEALDTERAEARLRAASRAWDLGPTDRASAFVYLGMLDFELGRTPRAERRWQIAMTLDPTARPPTGSSPKILQAFDRAKRTMPDPRPRIPPQKPAPTAPRSDKTSSDPAAATPPVAAEPPSAALPPPPPPVVPPPAVPPPTEPPPPVVPDLTMTAVEDDEGTSPWLWVGIGGAAVAVAAAVLVAVLAGGSDSGGSECAQGDGGCVLVTVE